jgi:outer membrane receptor protein involved in Fe transport
LPYYGYQEGLFACCGNYSSAWTQHSGSVALRYGFSPNVSAEIFYAGENSLMPTPAAYGAFDFLPPAGYSGQTGMSFLPMCFPQGSTSQNVSSLLEEKITTQLGRGVLQLAALQNRSGGTTGLNPPTSGTLRLYGAGCVGSASLTIACPSGGALTIFDGGMYSVTAPTGNVYGTAWTDNRDLLVSYVTPLGANFHAGASFVKSYYDSPETVFENYPIYGLNDVSCSVPSAISQTTNEMRIFAGGNLSEKTSLDISMYVANANYHLPDPNNIASYATPGADINYVDSNYTYAAPRLGFVWRPTAAVAVRAAAGGGFAEAPLNDLVGSNEIYDVGPYYETFKPNLNLQPEKSFGFDLGTDIRFSRNTVLSFDVYRTNLYGQLYNSTMTSGSCPTCGGLPLFVTQYGNLGESRYEGILVDVRHTVPHGTYWSLSGGLTRGYVVSLPAGFYNTADGTCIPATGANCTNVNVVPGANFNGTYTDGASVPYAQGLGMLGYRWNADKYVDLVGTYFGNNNTYFRPAFVELDGHIGYPLTRNVSLLVTFRNITGIYDGPFQIYTPDNFSGAPTISGLPYVQYGEMYGPRTVLLTTDLRL